MSVARTSDGSRLAIGVVCFPSLGGSGVVATELAAGLAERGHDVHLIATRRPGRAAETSRLAFHPVVVPGYPVLEHAPYTLAVANQIVSVARTHALDLVHVHYAVPHAASALLARQTLGGRRPLVVASLHGTDVTPLGTHPSYRAVTAHAVAAADAVVAPSSFLRDQAYRELGIPAATAIQVIPNFVDTDRFRPPDPAGAATARRCGPVLFHVSNLRAVKRPVDLIDVLARVRREVDARLVIVGDGPDRAATVHRAAALGLTAHVDFLGGRDDFAAELAAADVFVLPSAQESFGVAALEALSAGVPVCAYRVGGLPDLIDERVGRLTPPGDIDGLARAVLEVVADPVARAALSKAARAVAVERFRRGPAIERYEALYRKLLERS